MKMSGRVSSMRMALRSVEEFRVNADQYSGSQYQPSVGALSNGGFVVTWRDDSGGSHNDGTGVGSGYDVWARILNADGTEVVDEFRVNSYVSSSQYEPEVVGLKDGGFVVTWRDDSGHDGGKQCRYLGADVQQ